jgi:hypothetical protein
VHDPHRPKPGLHAQLFVIDEEALRRKGVTDFSQYAALPGAGLLPDLCF